MVILRFKNLKGALTETLDTVKGIYGAAFVLMMNVSYAGVDTLVRHMFERTNAELLELQKLLENALHIMSCVKGVDEVGGPEELKASTVSVLRIIYDHARRFTMLRTSDAFTRAEACSDMGYNGAIIEAIEREVPRLYAESDFAFNDYVWWRSVPGESPCKRCANLRYSSGYDDENRCDMGEVNCPLYHDWKKWISGNSTD